MSLSLLTAAQRTAFSHLIEGKSNKEIADAMGCSVSTLKTHLTAVLKFFNCDSRCRLVAKHYRGEL